MRRATFAVLLLSLAACKSRPPYASGYLGDYSDLKPSPRYVNSWGWQHPGADFSGYDRLVIEPILVQLVEGSRGREIGDADMRKLVEDFRAGLVAAIDPYYDIVPKGGPHTMRLQVVLTDVWPASANFDGGIAIEAEANDTVTGVRLVKAVSMLGYRSAPGASPFDPEALEATYAEWGRRVVGFLDAHRK